MHHVQGLLQTRNRTRYRSRVLEYPSTGYSSSREYLPARPCAAPLPAPCSVPRGCSRSSVATALRHWSPTTHPCHHVAAWCTHRSRRQSAPRRSASPSGPVVAPASGPMRTEVVARASGPPRWPSRSNWRSPMQARGLSERQFSARVHVLCVRVSLSACVRARVRVRACAARS